MKIKEAMVNYRNGKIYKVVNDVNNFVYVGSTTNAYLSNRMAMHRFSAKKGMTIFWKAMREIGVDHFQIILIELFPCGCRAELEAEEYRILQLYQMQEVQLYNMIIHREEFSSNFKRGCVSKRSDGKRWEFQWQKNGERFTKSFAIKKWGGEWGARKMAEAYQNYIYPLKV